jgi:hypothetical protein
VKVRRNLLTKNLLLDGAGEAHIEIIADFARRPDRIG